MISKLPVSSPANLGRDAVNQPSEVNGRYDLNDLYSAMWLGEGLNAAVKLDLAEEIDGEIRSCEEIARSRGFDSKALYRLMRALAANGIFEELPDRCFRHTPLSRQLRVDHPYSFKPMARLWGHDLCRASFGHLANSVENGKSGVHNAFGRSLYDHLPSDPDASRVFNEAMVSNSRHVSKSIAQLPIFKECQNVVDLGGGVGTLLAAVLREHQNMRGVLYELPYMKERAEEYLAESEVGGRAEYVPGSFLESVPPAADLYLIKNTLWNLKTEESLQALKNVRRAIGSSSGRLMIIEYVIEPANAAWTTLFDLQMLNIPGGETRYIDEYKEMLAQSGLQLAEKRVVEDQTILMALPD